MALLLLLAGAAPAFGAESPLVIKAVDPTPVETYRGVTERLNYTVVNTSKRTIAIQSIRPRKGEGSGKAVPSTLEPGASGTMELTYVFPEALGRGQVNFLVRTDDPVLATLVVHVPYFVQSAYDPEFSVLDFGNVHVGERMKTVLDVSSRNVEKLAFSRVVSKPEWLDVSFQTPASGDPQTVAVVATMSRAPGFGISAGEVVLDSNVREDSQIRIPVVLRMFNKYSASPLPFTFGGVLEGESKRMVLRVQRRGGEGAARIARIDTGSDALTSTITPCGTGCADIAFAFDSLKAKRGLRKRVTILFEDDEVPLEVPVDVLVLPNGVGISDLGDLDTITVRSTTSEAGKP